MAIIELETTDQGLTYINTAYIVAINTRGENACEVIVRSDLNYGVQIAASAKDVQEIINTSIKTVG